MTLIQKEVKNMYIGEYVAPSIYSYDFRNKTQAQVETDWWTIFTPYNSDADGYYTNPWGALRRTIVDLASAKKVTINAEMKVASGSSIWSIGCAITDWSTAVYGFVSWNTSSNKWTQIYNNWARTTRSNQYAVSWDASYTLEIDLVTGAITSTVVNNWNTQSITATATASTIAAIVAGHKFETYPDSSSHRLKTIQITVEY